MRFAIYCIIFLNAMSFGSYVCASEKHVINASLVVSGEDNIDLWEFEKNTWNRFGINLKSYDKPSVVFIQEANLIANFNKKKTTINWRDKVPASIFESGKTIDPTVLREWGMHEDFIKIQKGGEAYRFPSILPKSLFIDENGQVKKEIILNFPVGQDLYEAHLTIENPEKIKTSVFDQIKSILTFQKIFGGFLAVLAAAIIGYFYTKAV